MNRQEFEHIIKACANATNGHEFLIIGSQAILGSVPDAPRELRVSMELDVCPLPFTESAAAIIDGNIGELTRFHETFYLEEIVKQKIYEFRLFAAPLKIKGGTASPIRLLALA